MISFSSCESGLHSLVSCACDGIYIACVEFALGCETQHVVFTDNSAARQLACKQGNGKVRHLSGKVLWSSTKPRTMCWNFDKCPYRCGHKMFEQAETSFDA